MSNTDLASMTISQLDALILDELRELARANDITGYTRLKKTDLIMRLLRANAERLVEERRQLAQVEFGRHIRHRASVVVCRFRVQVGPSWIGDACSDAFERLVVPLELVVDLVDLVVWDAGEGVGEPGVGIDGV
ncbi:MAG: hypothetical protein HC936_15970, partial [Leptolyngbyaceae cyanobacterium SU_3_3]|nr:hypothetical protein [Leptolyngbyaceae cyanobacterium SU_3_3]